MKIFLRLAFFILIVQSHLFSQIFPNKNSVLSSGDIYKISIKKTGVHKITRKNLIDLGISESINPREIKIYGNYGGSLPEALSESYPDDLIEFPAIFIGEEDGKLDVNDYMLFYAEAADKWKYDTGIKDLSYEKNIYSDDNFVFVKVSSGSGKRIELSKIIDGVADFTTNEFEIYEAITEDKTNLLGFNPSTNGSGKLWVGEYLINNQEKEVNIKFLGLKKEEPVIIRSSAYIRSDKDSKFILKADQQTFTESVTYVTTTNAEATYARRVFINKGILSTTDNPKFNYKYTNPSGADAWIDYVEFKYKSVADYYNQQQVVRNKLFESSAISTINFSKIISDVFCWDVTNIGDPKLYKINGNKLTFNTGIKNQQLVLLKNEDAFEPVLVGKIANQNYHQFDKEEMIILYHKSFSAAAASLANHRINFSKLKVGLVDIDLLYNEFSSGKKDPTAIRNFAKMMWDRNPDFRYLLLFGDGTYDYKNLVKNIENHNFIPVYETDESLNPISSFPTDDYYALLSDNEGSNLRGALDIGVGRLTVSKEEDANKVVAKIIRYDISPERFGEWKLNTGFSADDEDSNYHVNDADEIARESQSDFPEFNQQKAYLDAFKQENTPGGERYNECTEYINQNINKGQLTWSYLGHGGPKGLAQERVVKISDIQSWSNKNRLTMFITATCSFAGYDDPSILSGGEEALINENGGAIALLTTVRPVYANANKRLTSNVYKNAYIKKEGKAMTFSDIIVAAKNATGIDTTDDNTRKFTLLGDPAQRLAVPEHSVTVIKINGKNINDFNDTLGALQKVVIEGQIENFNKQLLNNFNGEVNITIFDKPSKVKTLANDEDSFEKEFNVYKNVLYKGATTAVNGKYKLELILPKDINYSFGKGKISLYANNDISDASGYFNNLNIGGSALVNNADNTPPAMQLFMNDENFVYGGITDENPTLLIKLKDDLGINITGNSVGHDITAKITSEGYNEEFILNDFYKGEKDNASAGRVEFPLAKLKPGNYTAIVKAWDISNNSVEGKIEFRVLSKDNTKLTRVINYPNPFTTATTFSFEHDLGETQLDILLKIYTISGKIVKTIENTNFSQGYRVSDIKWDGKEDFGSNLAKGVYLYKIEVSAPLLGVKRESDFMKLVKI